MLVACLKYNNIQLHDVAWAVIEGKSEKYYHLGQEEFASGQLVKASTYKSNELSHDVQMLKF
jgi:hypothetical protein